MYLEKLQLVNFKNYAAASIHLLDGVNCFSGSNGSGKTNLLDAVYYLGLCKSYFTASDVQNIKQAEPFSIIQGDFVVNGNIDNVFCSIRKDQKKIFKRNNEEYQRLSDHIGIYPMVMIVPQDQELITEGSEIRRRFIDSVISQCDHLYLHDLVTYNRFLAQRNALLKQSSSQGNADYSLFEYFDLKLNELGTSIFEKRKIFFELFEKLFLKIYRFMTESLEDAELNYQSQLHSMGFSQLLQTNFKKDLDLQYSSAGIHKDDMAFSINKLSVKKFASQGQQKTYITSLKLAQYEYIMQQKNLKPIVMLDDIYDKLDDNRVSRLMQLVSEHEFGQLLITDTNGERIKSIFKKINEPVRSFIVSKGEIISEL